MPELADANPAQLALEESKVNDLNARTLAKQNPAVVANIVRGWVSGEQA